MCSSDLKPRHHERDQHRQHGRKASGHPFKRLHRIFFERLYTIHLSFPLSCAGSAAHHQPYLRLGGGGNVRDKAGAGALVKDEQPVA